MQRLFDIKKTQLEMVRDRGYIIPPEEDVLFRMSLSDFTTYANTEGAHRQTTTRAAMSRFYSDTNNTKKILVYFGSKLKPDQKQIPVDVVREFTNIAQTYKVTEAILILDIPLASTAGKNLEHLTSIRWQVFMDDELTYNPTTHIDTPHHVLLTEDEKRAKMSEMKVNASKLLIIRESDPIVRYYGWKSGGLVKIERDDSEISILTPRSINYRIIVSE